MTLLRGAVLGTVGVLAAGLVAAAPVTAAPVPDRATAVATVVPARTVVSGWPTSLRSANPKARLSVAIRVTSPSGVVARTAVVQRYVTSTRTWVTVLKVRTGSAGRAVLHWTAPATPGTVAYRLRVTPIPRAVGVTTAPAVLRVAAPVADPVLADLVRAINAARATARTCGSTRYPAVPAVTAHATLTRVAEAYAERLGKEAFFSHTSPSGDGPDERITAAGYPWRSYGENIAAGYPSVASAMTGWLNSPGHCANIMSSKFTEVGPGYANVAGSPYGTYWVTVFARR